MKLKLDRRAFDEFGIFAALIALTAPQGSIVSVTAWILMLLRALWLFEDEFE